MNYRRIIPNSISALSLTFGVLSIFDTFEGNFSRAVINIAALLQILWMEELLAF